MMIVTFQTEMDLHPALSVHGEIIKIDLGALLLEMDKETFKNMIANLTNQAEKFGVYNY